MSSDARATELVLCGEKHMNDNKRNSLRPCLVREKEKAWFHQWGDHIMHREPYRKDDYVVITAAIVEYEDGRVLPEFPKDIRFIDTDV